jgi:hypothetical protein
MDTIASPFVWWRARQLRYNVALVIAGIVAFFLYVVVCATLVPKDVDVEITVFTVFFQGIGYLFMMGVANLCYFIGPLSELVVRPTDLERYRRVSYRFGFWFSVLLPFGIPVSLVVLALFHPTYWKRMH